MRGSSKALVVALLACAWAMGCSDDDASTPPGVTADAGAGGGDAATEDSGAAEDAAADAPRSTGKTAVVADIGGVLRTLDRAQFGDERDDAGVQRFHIEVHAGGSPECPTASTPSPDRTLIVSGVPRGEPGQVFTASDGVTASFFDFKGDQLGGAPLTKATEVRVTIVAIDAAATPATVEVEVLAKFAEGEATGRLAAAYCQSLSL